MHIRLELAWWEFWVGVFWDRRSRTLKVLPVPMIGVAIQFGGLHG
jgi:hypothetical protein